MGCKVSESMSETFEEAEMLLSFRASRRLNLLEHCGDRTLMEIIIFPGVFLENYVMMPRLMPLAQEGEMIDK
ncbi:hypothetical protein R3W88_022493 [Solanum pinnatisectum]|uniref:Uncharacterized protein n=1 Tax=Solanum pinnatisectum TaxID=50273 RepID=A0AAV9LUR4_9SOLN|nr:hypothetical protein R3W88_022493 [Solanum pinnatisectum]